MRTRAVGGELAGDASGFNIAPFASMAGGWIGPLLMFWLYVWGPLRPFDYPEGDLLPRVPTLAILLMMSVAPWWLPRSYYEVRPFERSGRIYQILGIRLFRRFVPDGDLANRLRRRREPDHRLIRGRRSVPAFIRRTELSERGHLVWLLAGVLSAAYAWQIDWPGWALYLTVGNVLVNLYPILLQRYTRARLIRIVRRQAEPKSSP
jgi:hypothetical protein